MNKKHLLITLISLTTELLSMQKKTPAETAPPTTMPPIVQYNLDGTINGFRPSFYPKEEQGLFLAVDLLYLQGTIDGFAYAWTYPESTPTSTDFRTAPIPNGQFHEVDYDWAPGARLSVGYHLPIDHWDLTLTWTEYRNNCTGNTNIPSAATQTQIALWAPIGFLIGSYDAQHAHAKWKLNYNTVDLILGRTSFATQTLVVNPFLGLRGAFIHQHFRTSYSNGFYLFAASSVPSLSYAASNNFNGWGFRPGLETTWCFKPNWSLYANSSLSALFGHYSLKQKAGMTSATYANLLDDFDHYYRNAFAFDLALGLKWEMFFKNDHKQHLAISFGYELSSWFSQNQLINHIYTDNAPGLGPYLSGDLGLQGVDLSARFDF